MGMNYLTPQKSLSQITRERADQMEEQNVDLYEAIAGLYEQLAALEKSNSGLEARVKKLEGGR